ncbi:MAG: pyridoxamine 5'-phosphate oxidase [Hyphomicrobiaceae bacterium]|nr:pyridoxamine 5'-phosphate oxidase [Hyphomicrobiaceae bacterium]
MTYDTTHTTPPPAPDFSETTDPFGLFATWLNDAEKYEINDPNGMALGTADADGLPNVRMVLLKGVDGAEAGAARGFVFYTNYESAKGRELLASSKAALLFHWKSLRRQVRVRGVVAQVTGTEADAYFATRARTSRLGAWASKQSRPLESRFALEKAVALVTARYPIGDVPRPPHWSGFRVVPVEMEFWHDRPFRLHERVVLRRQIIGDGKVTTWTRERLFP